MISKTAIIYPGVVLGKNIIIEDYCLIGVTPNGVDNSAGHLKTYIGDNSIIRSHTVIYAGNRIGSSFHAGHKSNIREFNEIGNNVSIGTLSVVEHHVIIEDDVRIHTQVFIPEYSHLKNKSWIGPQVTFTNAKYPLSSTVKKKLKGPIIEENAIVGGGATLLPGVKVGKSAFIGAGSVVTKSVESGDVVVGNPADYLKSKGKISEYKKDCG